MTDQEELKSEGGDAEMMDFMDQEMEECEMELDLGYQQFNTFIPEEAYYK
jgi:hypothetical protein